MGGGWFNSVLRLRLSQPPAWAWAWAELGNTPNLIRSFLRGDGWSKNPNLGKSPSSSLTLRILSLRVVVAASKFAEAPLFLFTLPDIVRSENYETIILRKKDKNVTLFAPILICLLGWRDCLD